MRDEIQQMIQGEEEIPPLPEAALQVQALIDDPNITARELATVISSDSTLTARLLKHANSSFYGFPKAIGTVPLAVVVLGFDAVREIVVGTSVTDVAFKAFEQSLIESRKFWSHSLAVGVGARIIAQRWRTGLPGEAFVAGLLHDIGRLLLASKYPDQYAKVVHAAKFEEQYTHEAERIQFDTDHAEVIGWLMERWQFPEQIRLAASGHHDKVEEFEESLKQTVILANWLAHRSGYNHGVDGTKPPTPTPIIKALPGFDEREVRNEMTDMYRKAIEMLDMITAKLPDE